MTTINIGGVISPGTIVKARASYSASSTGKAPLSVYLSSLDGTDVTTIRAAGVAAGFGAALTIPSGKDEKTELFDHRIKGSASFAIAVSADTSGSNKGVAYGSLLIELEVQSYKGNEVTLRV